MGCCDLPAFLPNCMPYSGVDAAEQFSTRMEMTVSGAPGLGVSWLLLRIKSVSTMDGSLSAARALQLTPAAAASAVALTLKLLPGSFTAAGSLRSSVTDCLAAPNPWPRTTPGQMATHPAPNHFRVMKLWRRRRRPLYPKRNPARTTCPAPRNRARQSDKTQRWPLWPDRKSVV